jgi:predicted nucleotidyltransferase
MNFETEIARITERARQDKRIAGLMLFGSFLKSSEFHDIDLALFVVLGISDKNMVKIRIEYLKECPDIFDIQIFNLLPLVIQKEILSGKVLLETTTMYDMAFQVIREYEDFEKYIIQYRERILL